MRRKIFLAIVVIVSFFFSHCATRYRTINPGLLDYASDSVADSITYSFNYDVLLHTGNAKYAKKEKKKGIRVVALKITNTTGAPLNLSKDITFYTGSKTIIPLDPYILKKELKQAVPFYLFYLFLTPLNIYTPVNKTYANPGGKSANVFPVGLVIGPLVTAGNMLVSGYANKHMFNEMLAYSVDQWLDIHQTAYCLIGFRTVGEDSVTLKRNQPVFGMAPSGADTGTHATKTIDIR